MDQVDNEGLVTALEGIVKHFSEEIGPHAV